MVLCKFYQHGTCRFGSKCHNEHFDVRQIIKTDVEAAINGKQWPLSSYGPFKDKPSIPNFIDDQLFEEVRMLCYEAKQNKSLQQFHLRFTNEVLEASNKMKALLNMTPDIVDIVIKCYDAPAVDNNSAQTGIPFGAISSGGGFFGNSLAHISSNENVFGAGKQDNNSTLEIKSSFEGGFNNSSNQSIFGSSTVFGNTNVQQQTSSMFSQHHQPLFSQSQQQSCGNGFGSFSQQVPKSFEQSQFSGNIFTPTAPSTNTLNQTSLQLENRHEIMGQSSIHPMPQSNNQPVFGQQSQNLFGTQYTQHDPISIPHSINSTINNPHRNGHDIEVSSVYSNIETLTAVEIEAFKSNSFQLGKLPKNPPPKELIN
ncbi:nucleoporin NUP42 [Stomoxys calcitrans]|uniref:Nucleoporin NUP42 n=1 Tax=Stomoxys calcitrans TaxID=35570 RepID=A0A1I8QBC8_STOCA|nr:nucleoporin NUP42 [Stomoxys calcitrans]